MDFNGLFWNYKQLILDIIILGWVESEAIVREAAFFIPSGSEVWIEMYRKWPEDSNSQLHGIISNSNWTKWSTIQGVIARVISKSDEREAWGRFENTSVITPWIVRHEVKLLINRTYNKFRNKKFFWAKTYVALFISFENCRKHCEGSHQSACNWRENHVGIQLQVSNYKKFKSDTCNWTPTWSRADYVTNRRAENQSRSRILL